MPSVGFALVAYNGDIYSGLWFPIVVALSSVLITSIFLTDRTGSSTTARPTRQHGSDLQRPRALVVLANARALTGYNVSSLDERG